MAEPEVLMIRYRGPAPFAPMFRDIEIDDDPRHGHGYL